MPLTPEQELTEHLLKVEQMTIQNELFKAQLKWEPLKVVVAAAGAGAGVALAIVGVTTFVITVLLR